MTAEISTRRTTFERAVRMVYRSQSEWPLIARETGDVQALFIPYTLWVGLLPSAIAAIIPMAFVSVFTLFSGQASLSFFLSVWHIAWAYVLGMGTLLIAAKVLSLLAGAWGANTDWLLWCRVLVYGSTPYFLSGAFAWIPFLGFLFMIACAIRSVLLIQQGYQTVLKKPITTESMVSAG